MKTPLKLAALWAALAILIMPCMTAQTYPDYVLGHIAPKTMASLVRQYSPTQVVSAYRSTTPAPNYQSLVIVNVVDIGVQRHYIELKPGYEVYDMEVVDDYLIMCGRRNNAKAFIGCVDIQNILGGTATVYYHDYDEVSFFSKMVAFKDPLNNLMVYTWGQANYISSIPGFTAPPCTVVPCTGPYSCSVPIIVEFINPQTPAPSLDYRIVFDSIHHESIDDIVLTDNYVVFLGEEYLPTVGNGLTVHVCDRNNVLSDFNNYYFYPAPNEGFTYYLGCHMNKDTIAVTSRGRYLMPGWSEHDTRIRVIDAHSMTMTSSQAFDLDDYKTDPIDMIYLPDKQTIVLLEDLKFPPGGGSSNYTFLFLEPYNTFPGGPSYSAKGFFESSISLAFYSMDRLSGNDELVSTGGDYWILKKVPGIGSMNPCYRMD